MPMDTEDLLREAICTRLPLSVAASDGQSSVNEVNSLRRFTPFLGLTRAYDNELQARYYDQLSLLP